MKKRTFVGAVTRPISLTATIRVENPYSPSHTNQYGVLVQQFDSLEGTYNPDRNEYPTLLGLHVLAETPGQQQETKEVSYWGGTTDTIAWEVVINGVTTPITSLSVGDFSLYYGQLLVRHNQNVLDGDITVRATGTFQDWTGHSHTAVAEVQLKVSASSAMNLVLLRDQTGQPRYVGESYSLNPLTLDTVAKLENGSYWKRMCAVQLCDGATPLPDAFPLFDPDTSDDTEPDPMDEDWYQDTPQGSAYYFWFYRTPDNNLIQCTQDTEWLDAAWTAHGTASKVVTVDLMKVRKVRLVCRAGYIPYGQIEEFLDDDGILRPEKLALGFREQTFEVSVELPDVERITVADIAFCRLEQAQLAASNITIVKRALVVAGGTTLNDLSETMPHASNVTSWVEKLYNIEWFVTTYNGDEVSIGTGEWLQITPAQLALAYGNPLQTDAMPQMSVSVEPTYPRLTGNNYVEGYMRGGAAITPSQRQGNKEFLKQIDFFLLDTTDNGGAYTTPLLLQRDNILRFAGGSWAPVVGISADMAADAELELWRKDSGGSYVKYCDAGAYDAEGFVDNVLRHYFDGTLTGWKTESNGAWPRLYKDDGNGGYTEAHALLPWETTETKWTVGIGFRFGVYLLDHVVGESGWEWNGIFTDVTEWDGIDLKPYYLAPTAIAPGPSGKTSNNKLRNFFWLERPSGWSGGCDGYISGYNQFNEEGRHYPYTATGTSGPTGSNNMNYARANNDSATRSYPFAEMGFHALNTLMTSFELLYSRRNLANESFFGNSISGPAACGNETQWRTNGGVRFREEGSSTWSYAKMNAADPLVHTTTSSSYRPWTYGLNNARAKEQVMESQIVASFATEFGIAATTTPTSPNQFIVYGGTYWWTTVTIGDTLPSLGEGYMNCRVYKEVIQKLEVTERATSEKKIYSIEVCLNMSLYGGIDLCGDIHIYVQGGFDMIYTGTKAAKTGLPISAWLIPHQKQWSYDTVTSKTMDNVTRFPVLQDSEKFEIEKNPYAIRLDDGTAVIQASEYILRRLGYSPMSIESGSTATPSTYECAYSFSTLSATSVLGRRDRLAVRCRTTSVTTTGTTHRFMSFAALFSNSNTRYCGCAMQALIGEDTEPVVPSEPVHEIEIWADEQCTTRPTGETRYVYIQINRSWNEGENLWIPGESGSSPNYAGVALNAPEGASNYYDICYNVDFYSGQMAEPVGNGAVVELEYLPNQPDSLIDVTGWQFSFGEIVG